MARLATEDVELGGVSIPAGSFVAVPRATRCQAGWRELLAAIGA